MLRPSRRHSSLVFLSGLGPAPHRGVDPSFADQCADVFAQLSTELSANGSSWDEMITVTVSLTDMKADLVTFQELWVAAFAKPELMPAISIVQVGALPNPGALYITCTAGVKL